MERLTDIHKKDVTAADYELYAIWVWDDAHEGFHPLSDWSRLPEEFGTLFIKAIFKTAEGMELSGYLVDHPPYAFGLFVDGTEYCFNLNLPDLSSSTTEKLVAKIGSPIFPLEYRADAVFENDILVTGTIGQID